MSKRTPTTPIDESFEYVGEIVKSYVDEETGKRYVIGAASGLEEDQDGERVSKRAITGMVNAVGGGAVKLTGGTHEQNWLTEIGDAVEAHVDPETDQFMVKTELPPEGVDAIADKAWTETHRRKMGFSIGGKLRAAYHELTDTGKKRKVLDSIDLRHLCLTDKPAYQHSFANAVAKTFNGDTPPDADFVEEDLAKDLTTGSWVPGGGGNSGQDSETGGKRNAGTRKPGTKGMSVDDDGKDKKDKPQDDDDEKELKPSRHLSCPECGHEFGAEIPVDMTPEERDAQDKRKEDLENQVPGEKTDKPDDDDDEDDDKKPASKSSPTKKAKEATVDLEKRIADLEALVAKQNKPDDEAVEKDTETEPVVDKDILKMVALATGDQEERLEKTRQELSEGFELLGKAVMEIREAVGNLPTGRKSTARVLKSGREDDSQSGEDEIAKAETVHDALLAFNKTHYGIE